MEVIDYSLESSTSKNQEKFVKEDPGDLLDKSWFFGNLLDRKTRMSRCYSDAPSPPSSLTNEEMLVGKSYEETYSSLKKLSQKDKLITSSIGLIRTPSLPEESIHQGEEGSNHMHRRSKSRLQKSSQSLFRAPSLPTSLGRDEIQDEESDFSMSKLIRQASLKHSDLMLPPKRLPNPKSSSTERQRLRRKPDSESMKADYPEGLMIKRQEPISQNKLTKSSSDLIDEIRGFKDLSIKYDNQDLGPIEEIGMDEDKVWKSYLSDHQGWQPENSSSPVDKRSVEDMKKQIRFWARAVASNVRQEC